MPTPLRERVRGLSRPGSQGASIASNLLHSMVILHLDSEMRRGCNGPFFLGALMQGWEGYLSNSAARSPMAIELRLVGARGTVGMTDASTTCRPSTP
jgi:hypothetical protein